MRSPPSPSPSSLKARRSRLRELGFERVPQPPTTRMTPLGRWTYRIDAERPAMGTRVAITAIGRSLDRLEEAVGRAYTEMDRLIAVFTRYEGDSAICVLNDVGHLAAPPTELARVLGRAGHFNRLTRGAFDVSVAPLVDLYESGFGGPGATPPGAAEIAEARQVIGARYIRASEREIRFERGGMRVTLDGIAKGFIVDRMAAVLEKHRVRRYLIDGGGDIRTRGRNADRRPWTVAVRDPADPSSFFDAVRPGRGAVATSGSYERGQHGGRYHHLVDAGTGDSPGDAVSVSVVAPTSMDADALATAVFILGPAAGMTFIDTRAGCGALIVDRRGRRLTSRGWDSAPLKPDLLE